LLGQRAGEGLRYGANRHTIVTRSMSGTSRRNLVPDKKANTMSWMVPISAPTHAFGAQPNGM
jgi:hypothetical protein